MAETWYPQAIRVNGSNASYGAGRNRMRSVKCHYTVGVNSYPIGMRGYFQFLVNRDGSIYQFAPIDAQCWDSGEWNDDGPGIEVEYHPKYHDTIFNHAMIEAVRGLIRWIHVEHGLPLAYYDGKRIPEGEWHGFISHRSLIQSQPHNDFWPVDDWKQIVSSISTVPLPAEQPHSRNEDSMILLKNTDNDEWFLVNTTTGWSQRGLDPLAVIKIAEKVPYVHLPGAQVVQWVESAKAAWGRA